MLSPSVRVNEALDLITLDPDEVLTDMVIDWLGDIIGDWTGESVLRESTDEIAFVLTRGEHQAYEADPNADVNQIAYRLQRRLSELCFGQSSDPSQ
jgi:hypothetical protein